MKKSYATQEIPVHIAKALASLTTVEKLNMQEINDWFRCAF